MLFKYLYILLAGLIAAETAGGPPKFKQVAYWGSMPTKRLSYYCRPEFGIDTIVLAFIFNIGNGAGTTIANGGFAYCQARDPAHPTQPGCKELAADVRYCQSLGKTVLLSLGGGGGNYTVPTRKFAEGVADYLWQAYGPPESNNGSVPRPLGDVSVNGIDFDIEVGPVDLAYNYTFMVKRFREHFAQDKWHRQYYITGAPLCTVPDASMGDMIFNAKFDALFIQFYNMPTCSALGAVRGYAPEFGADQYFTFDAWKEFVDISFSKSRGAKIFIGLPADKGIATFNEERGQDYYIPPGDVQILVNQYKSHPGFGGVMVYDAATADRNVIKNCSYTQHVRRILDTGRTC